MVELTWTDTLLEATFLERPNRFVAVVRLNDNLAGEPVKAHVADPGRLKELLLPGARALVRDHGAECARKLRYTLEMVYSVEGHLVSLNTHLPNRLIGHLLAARTLPGFEGYTLKKREYTWGGSRFDFLLNTPDGKPCLLEVKSCTLVEDGLALFPDAPSVRGARHLMELAEATKDGYEADVLFVIQRSDATRFAPNIATDPALAKALGEAILAGVRVRAYSFELAPDYCRFVREVPLVVPQTL